MRFNLKKGINLLLFIALFLWFSYFIFYVVDFEEILQKIGIFKYILIPFISIFGSNTITASFLYPILFFLRETGTNLFLLVFLAAIGGVTGDTLFMFFGREINKGTKKSSGKIANFFKKHRNSPYLSGFVFLYAAFFPMPNEAMTFVLGYMKHPVKKVLLPLFFGNVLYYLLLILIGGDLWSMIF